MIIPSGQTRLERNAVTRIGAKESSMRSSWNRSWKTGIGCIKDVRVYSYFPAKNNKLLNGCIALLWETFVWKRSKIKEWGKNLPGERDKDIVFRSRAWFPLFCLYFLSFPHTFILAFSHFPVIALLSDK